MGARDVDFLAFDGRLPDERGNARHMAKRNRRTRGLEVVFDPKDHRDFVTGFHKRKKQRQKDAVAKLHEARPRSRLSGPCECAHVANA